MIPVAAIVLAATASASPSLETATSFAKLGARPEAGIVVVENGQPQYHLTFDVALEQYRNGKRDAERDQQWLLGCDSPAKAPEKGTSCVLTRTVLDRWGEAQNLGAVFYQGIHSTADRTLEIVDANWPDGKLDLNVVHADGSKTQVKVRLAYDKQSIFLDSLAASITLRDADKPPVTFDFRVPDYTYTQQLPVVMKGMKTAWKREWETFLGTLSPADQAIARKLVSARQEIVDRVVAATAKASMKAQQEQPPNSPASAKELDARVSAEAGAAFLTYVTEWLETSGMSAPAGAAVLEFLRSH